MKCTRHTADQIIRQLKTAQQLIVQGKTVVELLRFIEVTQPTYHRLPTIRSDGDRGSHEADSVGAVDRPSLEVPNRGRDG
jgi:hypothetical protein